MLTALTILAAVGALAALAGYVLCWASHQTTLVNIGMAILLALLVTVTALIIAFVMMRVYTRPLNPF